MGTFIPASPVLKVVGPPSSHNASKMTKSAYTALQTPPSFLSFWRLHAFWKKVTSDTGNGTAQCSVKWRVEGRNKESFYGSVSRCVGRRPLRNKSSRHPPPLCCYAEAVISTCIKINWNLGDMAAICLKDSKLYFCFERNTALCLSSWATDSWSTKLFLDIMRAA